MVLGALSFLLHCLLYWPQNSSLLSPALGLELAEEVTELKDEAPELKGEAPEQKDEAQNLKSVSGGLKPGGQPEKYLVWSGERGVSGGEEE